MIAVALPATFTACGDPTKGQLPEGCTWTDRSPSSLGTQAAELSGQANWQTPRVTGELLILKKSGLSAQGLNTLAKLNTQQVVGDIMLVKTPKGQSDRAFAKQLANMGVVTQPNYIYQNLRISPNDPGMPGNAGIKVNAGNTTLHQDYLNRTYVPEAWKLLEKAGKLPVSAPIAVLDSGVDRLHPDLQERKIRSASCLGNLTPTKLHGTMVTGVIAATSNNNQGLTGITWEGPVMAIEVIGESGGSTASLTKAITFSAQSGFKVINISAGAAIEPKTGMDKLLYAALTKASETAVVVAAAGNKPNLGIYFPAAHPDVIAVGSVGPKDGVPTAYTATPTKKLPRKTDIYAPGGHGTDIEENLVLLTPNNSYNADAGTSFSAPQVSAVASLMRAANPSLSAKETKAKLLEAAKIVNDLPHLDAETAITFALGQTPNTINKKQ